MGVDEEGGKLPVVGQGQRPGSYYGRACGTTGGCRHGHAAPAGAVSLWDHICTCAGACLCLTAHPQEAGPGVRAVAASCASTAASCVARQTPVTTTDAHAAAHLRVQCSTSPGSPRLHSPLGPASTPACYLAGHPIQGIWSQALKCAAATFRPALTAYKVCRLNRLHKDACFCGKLMHSHSCFPQQALLEVQFYFRFPRLSLTPVLPHVPAQDGRWSEASIPTVLGQTQSGPAGTNWDCLLLRKPEPHWPGRCLPSSLPPAARGLCGRRRRGTAGRRAAAAGHWPPAWLRPLPPGS